MTRATASDPNTDLLTPGLTKEITNITEPFVLVNIWSPHCEPCAQEISELNSLISEANAQSKQIHVLGIPVQSRIQEINAFIAHFKPHFLQWIPDSEFKQKWGSNRKLPYSILLNKNRKPVRTWEGAINKNKILEIILYRQPSPP